MPSARRGRPPQAMHQQYKELQPHITGSLDGQPVCWTVSSYNRQCVWVLLACGKHYKIRQLQSAARSARRAGPQCDPTVNYCKCCSLPAGLPKVHKASQFELQLYEMLEGWSRRTGPLLWVQETRVIARRQVDVWLPHARIALNVDGQQHFPRVSKGHQSTSSKVQAARDEAFNAAVMRGAGGQVRGLVRLHFRDDVCAWREKLKQAMMLAADARVRCFVLFTPSYRKHDQVDPLTLYSGSLSAPGSHVPVISQMPTGPVIMLTAA